VHTLTSDQLPGTGPAAGLPAVLARVVLPVDGWALPLHVDGAAPDTPTSAQVLDRRRVRVPAGARVSFATWFAAFPAGWWAQATDVRQVRLDVALTGPGRVELFASDAAGRMTALPGRTAPLTDPDGGWVWFEVVAGEGDVVLEHAQWVADAPVVDPGTMTLAVTTFDRPASALGLLRRLTEEPELLAVLDEVVVADQGTRRLGDEPGFADVRTRLGGRLRVVEQANLGGSGGFARGMLEVLRAARSRYVVLLDDDVVPEPESLLRAHAFAERCRTPTLVSCSMLDLHVPTVLHTPGERVDRSRFLWETVPPGEGDRDLAHAGLRTTPWLHTRLDVEFGGWWCCLVPVAVLHEVGLALPLFLKWDDVELALRAGAAGFPTVSLPGASVWHEPWTGKADTLDWQAYFHQRNRVVAALLHSPTRRGLRMLAESLEHTLVPLVMMRYAVVALRLRALEDVLAGPQDLHASLGSRLEEVRALRASYVDGRPVQDPPTGRPLPAAAPPPGRRRALLRLALEVVRTSGRTAPPGPPPYAAGPADARLWRLAKVDSAWTTTVAGTTAEHRRDAPTARRLLLRTLVLHARVLARWPALRSAYRAALPELTAPATWERTLERHPR
jgi:galactofuranosylgalactofuranosylrhamnosyl-N-acetylglucosaminyl-diphospho-decaprenol beta-1,5/1,6-galactofuranosyltransferase